MNVQIGEDHVAHVTCHRVVSCRFFLFRLIVTILDGRPKTIFLLIKISWIKKKKIIIIFLKKMFSKMWRLRRKKKQKPQQQTNLYQHTSFSDVSVCSFTCFCELTKNDQHTRSQMTLEQANDKHHFSRVGVQSSSNSCFFSKWNSVLQAEFELMWITCVCLLTWKASSPLRRCCSMIDNCSVCT